jgi:hypothetical protein
VVAAGSPPRWEADPAVVLQIQTCQWGRVAAGGRRRWQRRRGRRVGLQGGGDGGGTWRRSRGQSGARGIAGDGWDRGVEEMREKPRNGVARVADRKIRVMLQHLLEAKQCTFLPQNEDAVRDRGTAGDSLTS